MRLFRLLYYLVDVHSYGSQGFFQKKSIGVKEKNFGIANQKQNTLLPLGLECRSPTPMTNQRFIGSDGKIVNGTAAGINWPFIVRLKIDSMFQCGGAILNEQWIVTASHCLHNMNFVQVSIGDLIRDAEEVGEINMISREFFTHPDYNPITMENDVALLKLPKPLIFSERIKPICLASTPPIINKRCFIAGWGTTSAGGMPSSGLLEAAVPIIGDERCSQSNSYGTWYKKETMICAGKFDSGGTDSCQGDSGGPLICVEGKEPILTGVVSWGVGCAQKLKPGVYNRIAVSKPWIEKSVLLGRAADPATLSMAEVKPAPSTTPRFTTKSTVKPTVHIPTVPVPAGPLLPNNLKCTANSLDNRYGSRLYRSMVHAGLFDRIILGQDVRINSWKWITHFGTCGATLIAQRWAMTAAHCCNPTVLDKPVTFGSTQFDGSGEMTKEVKIVDFHLHDDFNRNTFENDICLLQLSENIQANPNIAPACLPNDRMSDDFEGECFIAGWGVLAEQSSSVPTTLQEAIVPYVNHEKCQQIFKTAGTIFEEKMFCFGGKKSDSCQGDSGGPLICVENNTPIIRGIVSFGKGCGRPGLPGIYTRVSTYIDWIDDTIERMMARTSCGPVRSAFKLEGDDLTTTCSGKTCMLTCKTPNNIPTVEMLTCINPVKKRWSPTSRKTGPIHCMDKKRLNMCGNINDLYKFDLLASVVCDGGKACKVSCPGELVPNRDTLTCLNPKRKKLAPPKGSTIKCITKSRVPASQSPANKPAFTDNRDQPFTIPSKPRSGCKNIRKHHLYKNYFRSNRDVIVNCVSSCSNGKQPCRKPDTSHCRFLCANGQVAKPNFVAQCQKQKRTRTWLLSSLPATPPKCNA